MTEIFFNKCSKFLTENLSLSTDKNDSGLFYLENINNKNKFTIKNKFGKYLSFENDDDFDLIFSEKENALNFYLIDDMYIILPVEDDIYSFSCKKKGNNLSLSIFNENSHQKLKLSKKDNIKSSILSDILKNDEEKETQLIDLLFDSEEEKKSNYINQDFKDLIYNFEDESFTDLEALKYVVKNKLKIYLEENIIELISNKKDFVNELSNPPNNYIPEKLTSRYNFNLDFKNEIKDICTKIYKLNKTKISLINDYEDSNDFIDEISQINSDLKKLNDNYIDFFIDKIINKDKYPSEKEFSETDEQKVCLTKHFSNEILNLRISQILELGDLKFNERERAIDDIKYYYSEILLENNCGVSLVSNDFFKKFVEYLIYLNDYLVSLIKNRNKLMKSQRKNRQEIFKIKSEIINLDSKNGILKNNLDSNNEEINLQSEKITTLNDNLKEEENNLNKGGKNKKRQIGNLKNKISDLEENIKNQEKYMEKKEEINNEIKKMSVKEIVNESVSLKNLKETDLEYSMKISNLEENIEKNNELIEKWKKEFLSLGSGPVNKKRRENLKREKENKENENKNKKDQISELKKIKKAIEDEINVEMINLNDSQTLSDKLIDKKLGNLETKKEDLEFKNKKRISQLNDEIEEVEKQIVNLEKISENNNQKIKNETNKRISLISEEINNLNNKRLNLSNKKDNLKNEMDKNENMIEKNKISIEELNAKYNEDKIILQKITLLTIDHYKEIEINKELFLKIVL